MPVPGDIRRLRLWLCGLMLVSLAAVGDELGDWQRQWQYLLEQMVSEADTAQGRAQELGDEARRLRDAARDHLAQDDGGDAHQAAQAFERAQLAFAKAQKTIDHAQRLLGDLRRDLRRASPHNLRQIDDDVRGRFQQARRQLTIADNAMQAAVTDFNAGSRRFDDAPGSGSDSLVDFVREQSQEKAFEVTRMRAKIKSAMIELRDQTRFLKDPACGPDIRARYERVLGALDAAQRGYLDADSVPTQADTLMTAADRRFTAARTEAEDALSRFEACLQR